MNNNVSSNKNLSDNTFLSDNIILSDKPILFDKLYYNYRKRISNENNTSTEFILSPIISETFYDIFNTNTLLNNNTNIQNNIFQKKKKKIIYYKIKY